MNVNFYNKKKDINTFDIFFIDNSKKNTKNLAFSLDKKINKFVETNLERRNFNGDFGKICHFEIPNGQNITNCIAIGIGSKKDLTDYNCQYLGGYLYSFLENLGYGRISLSLKPIKNLHISYDNIILNLALGLNLRSYSFRNYKRKA